MESHHSIPWPFCLLLFYYFFFGLIAFLHKLQYLYTSWLHKGVGGGMGYYKKSFNCAGFFSRATNPYPLVYICSISIEKALLL